MPFKKRETLAPNFLASYPFSSEKTELKVGSIFLFVFLSILVLFPFQQFQMLGILLLGLLLLTAVIIKIEWGIYALGFFALFHGWEVAFSDYHFTQNISLLNSVNAPLVDFIALVLLPCIILAFLLKIFKKRVAWHHLIFPTFFYLICILIAFYSAQHTHVMNPQSSFKYLGRPLIFIFLSFILLPHFFIQSKIVLKRLLKLWFWVGLGIALFGLSSLFMVSQTGWLRIQPYGIGSFAPLGVNHNLIAEVLVYLIPIGLWLMWEKKRKTSSDSTSAEAKKSFSIYFFGTGIITLVALGTLSRAAWISIFVEMVFLLFLFREQGKVLIEKAKKFTPLLFLLGAFFAMYMIFFLTSNVVSSSNSSRVEVTKIAWFYTQRSPIFGHGPGSFVPILEETYVHTVEFGEPLDSHGFIQKILVEEGFLGLLFFSLFLLSILSVLYQAQKKNTDPLYKLLFVLSVGTITFQLFNTSYFNSVMWMPLGVALAGAGLSRYSSYKEK